jgi:aminopeptidase N
VSLELHRQILATLSAVGLASGADLDAYAAADPVGGQVHRATCRAMRPDPAAKQAAWTAALAAGQPPHLAVAHASGVWVPGQEDILAPFRDRYFGEALAMAAARPGRTGPRLARFLYPATLADPVTIAATEAALASGTLAEPFRLVLAEQLMTLCNVHAAWTKPERALPARARRTDLPAECLVGGAHPDSGRSDCDDALPRRRPCRPGGGAARQRSSDQPITSSPG